MGKRVAGPRRLMRRLVGARVEITIARQTIAITEEELSRLLRGLAELRVTAAASVAEEISALHLAGIRVQLLPSKPELQALNTALRAVEPISRGGSGLTRLRTVCEACIAGT